MTLTLCNSRHEAQAIQRRWNIIVNAFIRKGNDERKAQALTKRYFDIYGGLWEPREDDDV